MIGKLDPEFLRRNEEKQNRNGKIIGTVMMIGSLIITVIFGLIAYQSFEKYSWSETKGRVTYAEYFRGTNENDARSYYEYEYEINGVTYTGKDSDTGSRTSVEQPPSEGSRINVYYNPDDPAESLVDSNYSDALSDVVVWTICCGPIFFIFGAVFYFVSSRKSQIQ